MLGSLIRNGAAHDDRPALIAADGTTCWGELARLVEQLRPVLSPLARARVAVKCRAGAAMFATLACLDELAAEAFLFGAAAPAEADQQLVQSFQLDALVTPSDDNAQPVTVETYRQPTGQADGGVTILTSGTTGTPKAARYDWPRLMRPVRTGDADAPRWLLTYAPHLYAGVQVALQCLGSCGTLVAPPPGQQPSELARWMIDHRVQFASATPSYWRRLLMAVPADTLRHAPVVQITLGGEVVDQHVLTALTNRFPAARIVHIYATTELGRCLSVTDGLAGFPTRFLAAISPDGVELRIDEDELLVRSANAMLAYDPRTQAAAATAGAWFRTGDLVEQRGDRVYFVGRRSDMINVGGNKVAPLAVEQVVRQVPGVAEVRVFGRASSLVGQLVACQVVPAAGQDAEALQQQIAEHCAKQLAAHQRPRLIDVVERIELTSAGKTKRSEPT